ncbi:MAG: acyl-CoA dehydrogenase family protein [Jatrophihabitans sp.]|uniref:acyl-CoA dehydrogenase family protein n=1 Tax=Jatrophihabitans sp. TaxID=1932789 RepID=UPI003F7F3104
MDFSLDDTQQAVAELATTLLRSDPDHARTQQALRGPAGYDETAWKALAQAGLLALALPEACGGSGHGPAEIALVLAVVGRQTLPLPALATLSLGVLPLARHASAEVQQRWLPEVADGRVLTGVVRGSCTWSDGRLNGRGVGVPYAEQAAAVVVPTPQGVVVVDRSAAGVALTRTPSSTGAPECSVTFTDVPADALDLDAAGFDAYAVAGAAAVADGVIAGALDLTAAHLRTRHQFGKPLATFQAVAQQAADVYVVARTMHLAALSASWRLAADLDAGEDLAVAAHWLTAEVPPALQTCQHLHGGLGVDITYPLHRFYAHGKDLARLVGGATHRLDALAAREMPCSSN